LLYASRGYVTDTSASFYICDGDHVPCNRASLLFGRELSFQPQVRAETREKSL